MKRNLCLVAALAGVLSAAPPPVALKVYGIFEQFRGAEARKLVGQHQPVAFRLSDTEINDYMRYALRATPRPSIDSVQLKIFANNYISVVTLVDFDALERWKPGTIPALLRPVLSGKKSVWVDYRLKAVNGLATFTVEKAYYQNVRLPAAFVQKAIQIVAARQPEKYDTSKPLPLPFGLRTVWTEDHVIAGHN
jgi:hypothetical protein